MELERLLKSLPPKLFDELVVCVNGSNPGTGYIAKRFGARVITQKWEDDFSKARQESFDATTSDFIMWLDADDILVNASVLLNVCQEAFANPSVYAIWMPYEYDHDADGNCCMFLWRERVLKRGAHKWTAPIHESCLPVAEGCNFRTEKVFVRHTVDPERIQRSAVRNLRISQNRYNWETENKCPDPRTTLYLAKAFNATGHFADAIERFEEYIATSDWDDERYEILCTMAVVYREAKQHTKCLEHAGRALTIKPEYGLAYFILAQCYCDLERWEDVVRMTEIGARCKVPRDIMPVDPTDYSFKPLIPFQHALFQLGDAQRALKVLDEAGKMSPSHVYIKECRKSVLLFLQQQQLERSAIQLASYYEAMDKPDHLRIHLSHLPNEIGDHPTLIRMRNALLDHGDGTHRLVIFCGMQAEQWSPNSIRKGVGGSEEAVIFMARLWARMGWDVHVYNNCDAPGNHDGVEYHNFWAYDKTIPCAIFIAWRLSNYVLDAPDGAAAILWCHDVQKMEYFNEAILKRVSKICVLSKYHRTNLPEVPDERFYVTRNGIMSRDFTASPSRDPLKCIYASSPDRGLDHLLEMWPEIHKRAPEAMLHVFYGFTKNYDLIHMHNERMMKFKEYILKMATQPGVHWHGMVSHAILKDHFLSAGLWLYPTEFTEISCITSMKAQAAGMIPVCRNMAALDETVQHGYKLSFSMRDERTRISFVNMTVKLLNNPKKQEKIRTPMREWAREVFDWKKVAEEWHRDLFVSLTSRRGEKAVSGTKATRAADAPPAAPVSAGANSG